MLTILPDKEFVPTEQNISSKSKDFSTLVAKNGQEIIGYITIDIISCSVKILDFSITGCTQYDRLNTEQYQLADALLKAAASYGMNRNVFHMESDYKDVFDLLKAFGFKQLNDKFGIEVYDLIRKCKNC